MTILGKMITHEGGQSSQPLLVASWESLLQVREHSVVHNLEAIIVAYKNLRQQVDLHKLCDIID